MSCIALLELRKAEELPSFMPSLIAMWSQPSVVKEINLHVLRLLMYLLDSASTPTVNDNEVDILEKFVVMMCDKSSTTSR